MRPAPPGAPRPAPEPAHDPTPGPRPSSHHTPSTTPVHLVLSVLKNTHALGHLGERKGEYGSDTRGRWGHWAQGACKRGMQAPGGRLFTPPAPHATAQACYPPPGWSSSGSPGCGTFFLPLTPGPTYHTSTQGSTFQVPSRSSHQIPEHTGEPSPCTDWCCTLKREGGGPGIMTTTLPTGRAPTASHTQGQVLRVSAPPTPALGWTCRGRQQPHHSLAHGEGGTCMGACSVTRGPQEGPRHGYGSPAPGWPYCRW